MNPIINFFLLVMGLGFFVVGIFPLTISSQDPEIMGFQEFWRNTAIPYLSEKGLPPEFVPYLTQTDPRLLNPFLVLGTILVVWNFLKIVWYFLKRNKDTNVVDYENLNSADVQMMTEKVSPPSIFGMLRRMFLTWKNSGGEIKELLHQKKVGLITEEVFQQKVKALFEKQQ